MVVRVRSRPGVEREKLARSASSLIWRCAYRLGQVPEQLRLEVSAVVGGEPVVVQTARSDLGRLVNRPISPPEAPSPRGGDAAAPAGRR